MVSLVTSTVDVVHLLSGSLIADTQVTSSLRLLREAIYLILLSDFVICGLTATIAPLMNRVAALMCSAALLVMAICALRSVMLEVPIGVIASGMRFLEYVPLAVVAAMVYSDQGRAPFIRIGRWVFLFVAIETIIAFAETRLNVALYGHTFIGSRAFGTFTHPNIFGATMAFCFLFLVATVSSRWRWLGLLMCLFDVLASGSRSGMLGMLAAVVALLFFHIRNKWLRLVSVLAGILLSPLILVLGSSSALTGRATGIGNGGGFERLDVWTHVLSKLHTIADVFLGWGMGLGSNTVFTLYGEHVQGAYISDNTFFFLLGSFGAVGVLLALGALWVIFVKLKTDAIGMAFFALWLLQLLVSQALETYPENVLAMIMLGWRLAVRTPANVKGPPPNLSLYAFEGTASVV
jgi:O-Antigen ligase